LAAHRRQRRELLDVIMDRLMEVLGEAREATSVTRLDELAVEVDGLVTHAVRYARHRTTDTRTMTALILAIDSARAATMDRRRSLLDQRADIDGPTPDALVRLDRARSAAE
jgi:predicted nucleotidyltransferase